MTRRRWNARNVGSLMLIGASATTLGCAGVGSPEAGNAPPPGLPTNAASYDSLVASYPISRNHHERDRCAKPICWGKVKVRIEAVGTTSTIDPGNAPATPVPVAHLVNLDNKSTESYYGLLPHESADYYLWVNRKPGSTLAEWRIVGKLKSGELVYGEATDLTYCHKLGPNQGNSDADFAADKVKELGKCNVSEGTTTASSTRTGSLSFAAILGWANNLGAALLTYSRTGGGWIECPNGCCT